MTTAAPPSTTSTVASPTAAQIKTRARVKDLAEVYTHAREVEAMLSMVPDMFASIDSTFMEPSCGSGNFLVEILTRKLSLVAFRKARTLSNYEHQLVRALSTVYGIDISKDNVEEARSRLKGVVNEHFQLDANTVSPTPGFVSAVDAVLSTNIICADTLKGSSRIQIVEYAPRPKGCFQRSYHWLSNLEQQDLWLEGQGDDAPVHYSRLAQLRLDLSDATP